MRAADRLECEAFGMSPKEALRSSWRRSIYAVTAKLDGRPEAMFGLSAISMIEGRGSPWFLGTDVVTRCGRALVELGPGILARMHATCSTLENRVACENRAAIRLLRHWGFHIGENITIIGGVHFRPFSRTA
ncbi:MULTISPECIES: hypothetical protein [unclassified Sphingomonas]|uniref:hypothetical protein n=1 Tax=unclassified Sphingomonas TaxID=196159 RepID=UPI002150BC48|nr:MULTISPECIES: hypothetical protein [unclassified Sphingomonas]MCR5872254.1 hypothetical protein [Sphingomonas sp. J344]UUX99439.1 hypothetical protein LRS08_18690 [Sphingomonas sp. J315]